MHKIQGTGKDRAENIEFHTVNEAPRPRWSQKTDLTRLREGRKDEERARNNSRNPWRRSGRCAVALSLYTDRANQVLICLKAAIWKEPKSTEFSIEIQGVPSPRPAQHLLNPSGRSGSIFWWQAHKGSIAPLFPSIQGAPNIGSVSLFLLYLSTCFFLCVPVLPSNLSLHLKRLLVIHHFRSNNFISSPFFLHSVNTRFIEFSYFKQLKMSILVFPVFEIQPF